MKPKVSPKMKLSDWLVDDAIPGDDDRTFVLDKVGSILKVSSDVADGKPGGSQKWIGIVPYLRLIHCITDKDDAKVSFLRLFSVETRKELEERKLIKDAWEILSEYFNDHNVNVTSSSCPLLHEGFSSFIYLSSSLLWKFLFLQILHIASITFYLYYQITYCINMMESMPRSIEVISIVMIMTLMYCSLSFKLFANVGNMFCFKISCLHVIPRFVRAFISFGKDNDWIEKCDVKILHVDLIVSIVTLSRNFLIIFTVTLAKYKHQIKNKIKLCSTSTTSELHFNQYWIIYWLFDPVRNEITFRLYFNLYFRITWLVFPNMERRKSKVVPHISCCKRFWNRVCPDNHIILQNPNKLRGSEIPS